MYYVIFILCLVAAQTKPMTINSSSIEDYKYPNLHHMNLDILQEIVLAKSNLNIDDVQTAKYYKECLNWNNDKINKVRFSQYGITMLNASEKYLNIIKALYLVNKTLNEKLVYKKEVLLNLNYFDTFFIRLPAITYEYIVESNKRTCNASARIFYYNSNHKPMCLSLDSEFFYTRNEHNKLDLPKAMASLKEDSSLENAQYVLQKLSEEGFNNTQTNIQKYIKALSYFNTIVKSTGSHWFSICEFKIYSQASQSNKGNQPTIPYLLIKDLLTDAK